MDIVDSQWHEPAPWLDWPDTDKETRRKVLTEILLASMDALGVDATLIFPIEDNVWSEGLAAATPGRFGSVPMISAARTYGDQSLVVRPGAPDLEERIAEMKRRKGVLAVRILGGFFPEEVERMKAGGNDRAFAACEREQLPVYLFICGLPEMAAPVAEKFPKLTIILDHIALKAPPLEKPDDPPWKKLPELLALAKYPNVSIKMCGAPALSAESYPYRDIWSPIRKLVDAFGAERLMWGSDIPRFRGRIGKTMNVLDEHGRVAGGHTYAQSIGLYRDTDFLTSREKEWILGGAVRQILRWPAS
jgi:L-fuconolactonase